MSRADLNLEVDPVKVRALEVKVQNGAQILGRQSRAELSGIIPLRPRGALAIGHSTPPVEREPPLFPPTCSRINELEPAPRPFQAAKDLSAFLPSQVERHMVQR